MLTEHASGFQGKVQFRLLGVVAIKIEFRAKRTSYDSIGSV